MAQRSPVQAAHSSTPTGRGTCALIKLVNDETGEVRWKLLVEDDEGNRFLSEPDFDSEEEAKQAWQDYMEEAGLEMTTWTLH